MLRAVVWLLLIYAALVLQLTLVPSCRILGWQPDLLAGVTLCAVLRTGRYGTFAAGLVGLVVDLSGSTPPGVAVAGYLAGAWLVRGLAPWRWLGRTPYEALLVGIGTSLPSAAMVIYRIVGLHGAPEWEASLWQLGGTCLYTALVAWPLLRWSAAPELPQPLAAAA